MARDGGSLRARGAGGCGLVGRDALDDTRIGEEQGRRKE